MPDTLDLIQQFNSVSTFPHIAIKINQLVNSESSTIKDFEEIIQYDPILSFRLLRMVNSSYFGLIKPIDSIRRAVGFLGLKMVRNLVMTEAMKEISKQNENPKVFSRKRLWLHSVTVAILARMISEQVFNKNGDDAFLAGIIHDIGMIIEDQVAGDLLRESCNHFLKATDAHTPIIHYEQDIIGTHHGKVGAAFVESWGDMSWDMYDAIKLHHVKTADKAPESITGIIQLADFFANRLNFSCIPGRYPPLPSKHMQKHAQKMMPLYVQISQNLPGEQKKAEELYDM